jgi:hypothetical protein
MLQVVIVLAAHRLPGKMKADREVLPKLIGRRFR